MKKLNVFREDGKALVSKVVASADVKTSVKRAVELKLAVRSEDEYVVVKA